MISVFENKELNINIETIKVGDDIWFKGKEVAQVLDYANERQAIRYHVDADDKTTLGKLTGGLNFSPLSEQENNTPTWNEQQSIVINESGLYALILHSKKKEAKRFQKWVTSEVLPSIRKTGKYEIPQKIKAPQIQILNETNLHYKVIDFIRRFYPHAMIYAGLGEHQTTAQKRADAYFKGYIGGQPDITIQNYHVEYNGFAIELKTPTGKGVVSEKQNACLRALRRNNHKTLISNDYDEIIMQISEYFTGVREKCDLCQRFFKTKETLEAHVKGFHKVNMETYNKLDI